MKGRCLDLGSWHEAVQVSVLLEWEVGGGMVMSVHLGSLNGADTKTRWT